VQHAPILVILIPLAASVLISVVALRRLALAHALSVLATAASAAMAWWLLVEVATHGAITYRMAGWDPATGHDPPDVEFAIGIHLVVDRMGAFVAAVIASMATLSMVWARGPAGTLGRRGPFFYAVATLALSGLLGMCLTGDAFNMFVFLEVASLAGYALVGCGGGRSQMAAFRYLMLGATGASLYLLGVGYLYVATGTLNLANLADLVHGQPLGPVALAFVVAGLAIKMGLFPLHAWMPDAYTESPPVVASFIVPIFTKVMAFAMIRFLFTVFGVDAYEGTLAAGQLLAWMGAIAAIVGAAVAATQTDLRRLLAWSSVGQIGYIAIGVGIGSGLAVAAALLHVMNHALMKGALFYIAGAAGAKDVSDLRGLMRRMPVTAVCLVIATMSLVGIPPLGGFFSKWYLIQASVEASQPLLAAAVVGGSLLAVIYVFRIIEAAFLKPVTETEAAVALGDGRTLPTRESGPSLLAPLVVAAALIVLTGILSQHIIAGWLMGAVG